MQRETIGWLCTYVPAEIIKAAGFLPVRLMPEECSHKGCTYLDANFCSYVLSILSDAMDKKYDDLKGIVFTNSCDGMRRLYDAYRLYIPHKFVHLIDVPFNLDEGFYCKELQNFIDHLEKHFSITITDNALVEAINFFNKKRELIRRFYDLRAQGAIEISDKEFFTLVKLSYSLSEEADRRIEEIIKKRKRINQEKKRLLISGTVLKLEEILNFLDEGFVVYDDLCSGGRFFQVKAEEGEEPLKNLASAYLNRVPCTRMANTERRVSAILSMVEEYKIDGVILYALKFCDTFLFSVPYIKKALKQKNVPGLYVEGLFEPSISGLKTRLQAFLEVLYGY